jgi:hypothetical protein
MMSLDVEVVRRRIAFLVAYARSVEAEIRAVTDRHRAATDRVHPSDYRSPASSDHDTLLWTLRTDAATAYRDAAQWAAFILPEAALGFLTRSADLYELTGEQYAYGAFLRCIGTPEDARDGADRALDSLLASISVDQPEPDYQDDTRLAVGALRRRRGPAVPPQQAAYAILAATGTSLTRVERRSDIMRVGEDLRFRESVSPVGSLGTPLRVFWRVAEILISPWRELAELSDLLRPMARSYGERVAEAQSSSYLWRHATSPVDVGNIELIGLTALIARRDGGDFLEREIESLGPVAAAPIRVGLELAGGER